MKTQITNILAQETLALNPAIQNLIYDYFLNHVYKNSTKYQDFIKKYSLSKNKEDQQIINNIKHFWQCEIECFDEFINIANTYDKDLYPTLEEQTAQAIKDHKKDLDVLGYIVSLVNLSKISLKTVEKFLTKFGIEISKK